MNLFRCAPWLTISTTIHYTYYVLQHINIPVGKVSCLYKITHNSYQQQYGFDVPTTNQSKGMTLQFFISCMCLFVYPLVNELSTSTNWTAIDSIVEGFDTFCATRNQFERTSNKPTVESWITNLFKSHLEKPNTADSFRRIAGVHQFHLQCFERRIGKTTQDEFGAG